MSRSLHIFGHPALCGDDSAPVRLNAKELALLVYLRVTGQPQSRGAIGEMLWANIRQGRNHSINNAVTALRRVLPPGAIAPKADPLALAVDLPCDTDVFPPAAGDEERALEAYRGAFLYGFEFTLGEGADGFIGWLQAQRSHYETEAHLALEAVCTVAAQEEDWARVRECARRGARVAGWQGAEQWLRRADTPAPLPERPSVPLPQPAPGAGRRPGRRVMMALAVCLAGMAIALVSQRVPGPPQCGPGESRGHLVRQIYPAEANLEVRPGASHTPTWFLANAGNCTWPAGTRAVRVDTLGGAALATVGAVRTDQAVPPESVAELRVPVRGPRAVGSYTEVWSLLDAAGRPVLLNGLPSLRIGFQVLPADLPACAPGEVTAELLAASHVRLDNPVRPGERFSTSWTIANRGRCAWDGNLALHFRSASGQRLSPRVMPPLRIAHPVRPAEAYTFEVPMTAPRDTGSYREAWSLAPASGGEPIRVSDLDEVGVRIVVTHGEPRASGSYCAPGRAVVGWLGSESIPDGTIVAPRAPLPKEWTLLNRGSCTWARGSLRLRHVRSSPGVNAWSWRDAVVDRDVPPAATYTFRQPFVAPAEPGNYRVTWSVLDARDQVVRVSSTDTIWADFRVRD